VRRKVARHPVMPRPLPTFTLVAAAAAILLAGPAKSSAVTVASDTFESSDHPTGNRTVVTGGVNGLSFYSRNATGASISLSIVDDSAGGGLGSLALNAVDTTSANVGNAIIGLLPIPINLAQQGDFVTLSFQFRYLNSATATANSVGFRFGIEGSVGTAVTGDNQGTTSDNDQGYYIQTGVGATTGAATNNTIYRENGGTQPIGGGTDRSAGTTNTTGLFFNDNLAHSATFTITRGTGTNVSVAATYDGGSAITTTFTTTPYYAFDEIFFDDGFVPAPVQYNVDNVTVTSNVPEPGTPLACLAGGVALLVRRRRR